jgi:hypothetical protein
MWVCLVGFGREIIFLWVLREILGDEIWVCCGATSMWWACVGDFGGSMDVWFADVVVESEVSFSGENECETNCFSRRATISSLHSLTRRRNSVRHSSKFDIVDGDRNTALIPICYGLP